MTTGCGTATTGGIAGNNTTPEKAPPSRKAPRSEGNPFFLEGGAFSRFSHTPKNSHPVNSSGCDGT